MSPRHPIYRPDAWQPVTGTSPAPAPATALFDVELGRIFLSMRNLLGVSLWDMARRVGAEPSIIADLEAGALSSLPPWPELQRLVEAYAFEVQVDPEPIIARLAVSKGPVPADLIRRLPSRTIPGVAYSADVARGSAGPQPIEPQPYRGTYPQPIQPPVHRPPASLALPAPPSEPLAPVTKRERRVESAQPALPSNQPAVTSQVTSNVSRQIARAGQSIGRGLLRVVQRKFAVLVWGVGIPALVLGLAALFPAALYGLLSPLPNIMARPLHTGIGQLVATMSPSREGLTWIDVGNPRLKKADRLPERAR